MHRAESILQAVATNLTGLATTGSNVVRGRVYPTDAVAALTVNLGEDSTLGEFGASNLSFIDRSMTVLIDAHVKTLSGLDTQLNQIRAEVYAALTADTTQGLPYVITSYLASDLAPVLSGDSDQPTGQQTFAWIIQYRHSTISAES